MDLSDLQARFAPVFRNYWIPIILGMSGFGFLLYGLIGSVIPQSDKGDILFESASTKSLDEADQKDKKPLTVDIAGAVIKPGVYTLKEDSRIQDALIAAGGLSDKADRPKIAKNFNLASKIIDGGKVYIPFIGEAESPHLAGNDQDSNQNVLGMAESGFIDINTASVSELDTLPGVGPATADKIISNRPYAAIDELLSKKAVGQSVFEKIKDKIRVN